MPLDINCVVVLTMEYHDLSLTTVKTFVD